MTYLCETVCPASRFHLLVNCPRSGRDGDELSTLRHEGLDGLEEDDDSSDLSSALIQIWTRFVRCRPLTLT